MILSKILSKLDYTVLCGDVKKCDISRIEYNSRKIKAGELFVCLPGAKTDGHLYARMAYDAGCRAFLCERPLELPGDAVQVLVTDARRALAAASAAFYDYPADELHVIGITGTKGKTTTALLIQSILNESGIPCAYIGSNGVIINGKRLETINTTPESRELHHFFSLMRDAGITHVALEVSSQALDHSRVYGIEFDVCVFTNLFPDHIGEGEHSSFEEYKKAKSKLFHDYVNRLVVYNADDEHASDIIGDRTATAVSYSIKKQGVDFKADNISSYRDATSLGIDFDCINTGRRNRIRMRTPGEFSVYNGLAAIAVCSYYGISASNASDVLAHTSTTGRFEIVDGLSGRTFIIDYAHNGVSLTSALLALRTYNPSRIICVFGSVGGRTKGRREELAKAANAFADYSIITSDNPDFEFPEDIANEISSYFDDDSPRRIILDREIAVREAVREARNGDIVLFAGKGHERYQLYHGKKIPFSERDIIIDECRAIIAEEIEQGV